MKRIYGIGIGLLCATIFGIYIWQEGTLSANNMISIEGAAVFVKSETETRLLDSTTHWYFRNDDTPDQPITNFEFQEMNFKFLGSVMSSNLTDLHTTNGDEIAAGDYGIMVTKAWTPTGEMLQIDPPVYSWLNVATYQKSASNYKINVKKGETVSPTGYGNLTCWTQDENKCSLTYKTLNETIATVSSTGEVTGVAEGTTRLYVKIKTGFDSSILEEIPVTVTNVQEPIIEFGYTALHPELKEGAIPNAVKIGTISIVPDSTDVSAYSFEIDGDAHLSIQNQEVFIASDTSANTYTYHVVVKKDGNEVFRSDPQTIQVLEPDPIPTPEPTPDPTPNPDPPNPDPTPDPAPQVTFQYTSIITSLIEGYQVQKIGSMTPSIQDNYYYEVKDANPCVEVTQNGSVNILANQSVGAHTFTIAAYTDNTKTNHLADVQATITITEEQEPTPPPVEDPFQFEYQYSEQLPDSILQRIYDPQNNTFQISTNKEDVIVHSLQEDILTISGTTATIHKACEEGVLLEAEYQNQTYQIKIQIAKAEQQPVSFASNQIDIAYGTLSYDPVFSGGSGTGAYVLTSSDPSKIAVSSISPSTLNIQEGATGEVRITLMRKGDENYRDSTSTQMMVRLLENEDPTDPDQPSDDPDGNPDQPPIDDELKKTIPSDKIDGTLTYEEGFPKEAIFRIEDITTNSTQDSSITSLDVQPKLVLRLHLEHVTLTTPATIKIPIGNALGNLENLTYYYENEEGILQEIHPILHQNELEFSSKVMGKFVIAQAKEEEKKEPDSKPTDENNKENPTPSDGSNDKQSTSNTPNTPSISKKNPMTVQKQGILTGDTTRLPLLILALGASSIFLLLWIRRKKHKK